MNKLKITIICLAITFNYLTAQTLSVSGIELLTMESQEEYSSAKFSPDGSKIYFTKDGFAGIFEYDRNSKSITELTNETGAGYEFAVTNDGEIYYRSDNYVDGRKHSTLKVINTANGKIEIIEADKRDLSSPCLQKNGNIVYRIQKNLRTIEKLNKGNINQGQREEPLVYNEDSKIILVTNGIKKILTPFGEGHYIWSSLSPDGTKLLFTLAGRGTYISDLAGNILTELGYANAPVWSADGKWILYMVDRDNGQQITSSDIFAVTSDGVKQFQLTNTADIHEMYPQWSPVSNEIVFNSIDGNIYLMKLNITE